MKQTLREHCLKNRKGLSEAEVQEKSKRIMQRLFSLPWFHKAKTVLFYVSYDKEVYTHDMIKESIQKGKIVMVPKADTKNKTLCLSRLKSWDELSPCAYTILEPRQECIHEVPVSSADLLIVPGIAFDLHGHRIGHGLGYYDRLLKQTHAHTVGLAFECQILESIPAEQHDEKVEMIITEERSVLCR